MKKGGRWLILIAIIALVGFLFLSGPNGLVKLIQMKQKEVELEKRMVELQADIELTRQKLEKLSSDPEYLRKIAKEKLQMIDPRDTLSADSVKTDSALSHDTLN